MLTRREQWVLLNLVPGLGSAQVQKLREAFGDLARVYQAAPQELRGVEGVGPALAQRIASTCGDERLLAQELQRAKAAGARLLTQDDAGYPASLNAIHDPPLALYAKGTLTEADEVAVAIVGTRRASCYGLQSAERLAYDLALRSVTIVSGLALGIDAAAHRGALKAGGRTIAVLGSGLSRLYPSEHEELAAQIVERGALVSEYPMTMEPLWHNFPRRNRLVSGLSLGVIVVEAPQRSGALITADCALEQGKEVFAVPGPMSAPTSQGAHELLKQGARLVTSAQDILDELQLIPTPVPAKRSDRSGEQMRPLPEPAQRILALVNQRQPRDIDEIAVRSGLPMSEVSSVLLELELKQLVQQLPGKRFRRSGTLRG